jgi:hypothetical protein
MANHYRYRSITPGSASAAKLMEEGMRRALTLPYQLQSWVYAALMAGGEVFAVAPHGVVVSAPRASQIKCLDPHMLEIVQLTRADTRWQVRGALISVGGLATTFKWDKRGRPTAVRRGGDVEPFDLTFVWRVKGEPKTYWTGDYTVIHYMTALSLALAPMLSGAVCE